MNVLLDMSFWVNGVLIKLGMIVLVCIFDGFYLIVKVWVSWISVVLVNEYILIVLLLCMVDRDDINMIELLFKDVMCFVVFVDN